MIGVQMSGFQDIYEVTENLGEPSFKLLSQDAGSRVIAVFFVCVRRQSAHDRPVSFVMRRLLMKCCFFLCFSVLSIHKRPTTTSSNFTFPLKGWRGMLDWIRTSEEKISVSRDALSIEQPGKVKETEKCSNSKCMI